MSFNFGPTLLSWLKDNAPRTLPHDSGRRAQQQEELQGTQFRNGAGLQPHHHAAGEPARSNHADPLGNRRLSISLWRSARRNVACRDGRRYRNAGVACRAWRPVYLVGAASVQTRSAVEDDCSHSERGWGSRNNFGGAHRNCVGRYAECVGRHDATLPGALRIRDFAGGVFLRWTIVARDCV